MKTVMCKVCGGMVADGKQKFHHAKRCVGYKQEGIDHLVCKECGYKTPLLTKHLLLHGMNVVDYRKKYGDVPVQLESIIRKRNKSNIGTHVIPIDERSGAVLCCKCGEWYLIRFAAKHLSLCVHAHPDKYVEGKDYVKCPECGIALTRLGEHLQKSHGWDKDRIALEVGRGLKLVADSVVEKWRTGQDFKDSQVKREKTHLERHGYSNPFADPEVRGKIIETNQRRYGADHPMQTSEIFIRQQDSAQSGPSALEVFFDEHTCDNVVYVGYGGRFIRTKTGVRKYGKVGRDLNPDFIILSDNVLESALSASKERRKLDNLKHRSRYVIELLGDWYHSEQMIGVKPEEHEKEIIAAYSSAGIKCLTLWEKDVMGRWNEIEPMVSAWIDKAVKDINEHPVWKKSTKTKADGRIGIFVCPNGSGKRFRTREKLERWMIDPLNFWRQDMAEGKDYVRCLECQNVRVGKIAEHLRQSHRGMTKEEYLAKHPGALTVADRVGETRLRKKS
jgi:predicted transcriptional regulator/uncharacterized C2H2 Zn-finger protein